MSIVRSPVRSVVRSPVSGVLGGGVTLLGQATSYLAGIEPHHWFDFVNNRALYAGADVGGVSGATGYSFSRASAAYYTNSDGTLTSFASGELRQGDRGVLIEGARTNLCLRSQEFDNAAWSKGDITVSANDTTAPDGTTTADLITEGSAGTAALLKTAGITVASGSTYTSTIYIKRSATVQWVRFIAADSSGVTNGVQAWFDIQNGAVGTLSARGTGWTAVSRSISALANGWYRMTLVYTTGATAQYTYINSASADNGGARVAASAYWLWGAQDELGTFPSSPIVTTTASATRAADVPTCTAGVSYPLSLWAEFERAVDTGVTESILTTHATSTDSLRVYVSSADNYFADAFASSANQGGGGIATSLSVGVVYKGATRLNTNSMRSALGGTLSVEDTTVTLPASPTTLMIGAQIATTTPNWGYIRRAAIFSSALSDADLQSVTT